MAYPHPCIPVEQYGDQDAKQEAFDYTWSPHPSTITVNDSMIPPAALQALHASGAPRPYFLDPRNTPLEDWLMLMTKRTLEMASWVNSPPNSQAGLDSNTSNADDFETNMALYSPILSKFCTPDIKIRSGFPETNLIARSLDEHKANLRAFLRANPNYHVEVYNSTVELYQRGGRACVILSTRVSGLFGFADQTRESVNRMLWVRRNDEGDGGYGYWQMCELASLRGPGPVQE